METGFDDEGVDLFEGGDVGAFCEEIDIRVVFDKFVGRIRGGEKVENGVRGTKTRYRHCFTHLVSCNTYLRLQTYV